MTALFSPRGLRPLAPSNAIRQGPTPDRSASPSQRRFTALQRRTLRRALASGPTDPSEAMGELNIVPLLDVVMNLIVFLMATMTAAAALTMISTELPRRGPVGPATPRLSLGVVLTDEGAIVTSTHGKYSAGCTSYGEGRVITVAREGDGYDWPALAACLSAIKEANPTETEIAISADPLIAYEHVVHAMDTARADEHRALFPDVLIAAGVR
jgi:biopolymer transport protein ExbD